HEVHDDHVGHENHVGHDDHAVHDDNAGHDDHSSETAETLLRFVSLSLHAAPALLFAYILTWLINFVKPAFNMVGQLRSSSPIAGALKGTLIGLPLPICIPDASGMYKQLIKAGCGSALAVSFLVASPVIGFDALLISLPLLGVEWVGIRLVMAVILAVTLGLLIGSLFKKHDLNNDTCATTAELEASTSRLKRAFEHGFSHLIDHTAPWVLFGLIAAATFTPTIGWQFLQQEPWLQVVLAILIALPFHFCATGITPVLAIMLIAGVSPGAVVAFSLVGPTLNLDLYRFIKDNQGKQIAVAVVMAIVTVALLLGLGIMYWVPELPKPWLTLAPHWQDDWWRYVSLVIVTVLFAISILRRGARSFMLELLPHSFRNSKPHHHHHH
uniref:permease n=1 Tax=Moritella dasanensis TaxID=428031 RepID=UPI000380CA8B